MLILSVSVTLRAQQVPLTDPMELYLRLKDPAVADSGFPSFLIRPVSLPAFSEGSFFGGNHPWSGNSVLAALNRKREVRYEVMPEPEHILHTVMAGETLFGISRLYNVSIGELMEWNSLQDYTIYVDDQISIYRFEETVVVTELIPEPITMRDGYYFYSPTLFSGWNRSFAQGQNDSGLWQGRGLSTALHFGVHLRYGRLSASIRPEFHHIENRDFELSRFPPPPGISPYGYSFSMIDYPQRFGSDPITRVMPGQSWIRIEHHEFSAGFSTANIWAGPSLHNAIVLSNNAPGFPHFFAGTHRPFQTRAGALEALFFLGQLTESDYFDENQIGRAHV